MNNLLVPGSVSTLAESVTDAVASCECSCKYKLSYGAHLPALDHRAQYFATANIPTLEISANDLDDEESNIRREDAVEDFDQDVTAGSTGEHHHHDMDWDEMESSDPIQSIPQELKFSRASPKSPLRESSPLLPHSTISPSARRSRQTRSYTIVPHKVSPKPAPVRRKSSVKSLGQAPVQAITGQSTYGQTVRLLIKTKNDYVPCLMDYYFSSSTPALSCLELGCSPNPSLLPMPDG